MKNILITLTFIFVTSVASAQSFVSEIREELGTKPEVNINIGTWLVKLIMNFTDENDEETKALMKGLKRINVTVFELDDNRSNHKLDTIIEKKIQSLSRKGFEQLVSVRDHGDNVYILAKVKGELMQDAMIIAHEKGDELAIVNLTGDVNLRQLAAISDEYDIDIEDVLDI